MSKIDLSQDDWYRQIKTFYGDKRSKRSGIPLINHIDEGLVILEAIGASERAMQAFCIHPMIQSDADFVEWFSGTGWLERLYEADHNAEVIALAIEYRSVANSSPSSRHLAGASQINLSPLDEVNQMLIADKVQNRKDFELYHQQTHPFSEELGRYFRLWLDRLNISEKRYQELTEILAQQLTLPES